MLFYVDPSAVTHMIQFIAIVVILTPVLLIAFIVHKNKHKNDKDYNNYEE